MRGGDATAHLSGSSGAAVAVLARSEWWEWALIITSPRLWVVYLSHFADNWSKYTLQSEVISSLLLLYLHTIVFFSSLSLQLKNILPNIIL
jgi:hypothetical protein